MFLLYVTLFRTLNTILEKKRRSNAQKTNREAMWSMGGGRVSCSGVYCFLPTCTQCSTITLRMARKIQFKLNYLIVQYCTQAHIWPWYNRHLWITDLVNSKFFPLLVCWTTYEIYLENTTHVAGGIKIAADNMTALGAITVHSAFTQLCDFVLFVEGGFLASLISQFFLGPVRNVFL